MTTRLTVQALYPQCLANRRCTLYKRHCTRSVEALSRYRSVEGHGPGNAVSWMAGAWRVT